MPLADARAHLATVSSFGDWREHRDREDRTWAALCSLEDATELVREASRLTWTGSPRGMFNVALHQRYGDAIAPWLLRFVDAPARTIRDTPWCIAPCLALVRGAETFRAVLDTDTLETTSYVFGTHDKLVAAMIDRDPETRWPVLAERALAGDAGASALFRKLVRGRSRRALAAIETALGSAERARVEKTFRVSAKLEASEILAMLDAAAAAEEWPFFQHGFEDVLEYVALRLVAMRGEGDQWGICLERLTGGDWDRFRFERHRLGSEVSPGKSATVAVPDVTIEGPAEYDGAAVGSTIRGPAGALTLTEGDLRALDLRPGRGCEPESGGEQLVLLRAYLARHPGALWRPLDELATELGLPSVPEAHLVTTAFHHEGGRTKPPSASKTYKTLARAIVARDFTLFEPGKDNTDWRKHLHRA